MLGVDGRTDDEGLMESLRTSGLAIHVDDLLTYLHDSDKQLDVDSVIHYMESTSPNTNVDAVIKQLRSSGRRLDVPIIVESFKARGFKIALEEWSQSSSVARRELDTDDIIRCLKSYGLHYDMKSISERLYKFRPKIDVNAIVTRLQDAEALTLHPLLLPVIMFQNLKESSRRHLNKLHTDIVAIEGTLKHVPVRSLPGIDSVKVPVEDQEMHDEELDYQSLSRRLNRCKKDQASRDGRQAFRDQFQARLTGALQDIRDITAADTTDTSAKERRDRTLKASFEIERWISFNSRVFEFMRGRNVNYRARIQAQLDLVRSFILLDESEFQRS